MARIDQLSPHDRTLVRRASVLGLSFHPRFLLDVLGDDVAAPDETTWARLEPIFADDGDGYLRFRRAVVRDAAYAGLAYRTRRRLHAAAARRSSRSTAAMLDEVGGMLSLHFHLAGDHEPAWRYGTLGRAACRRPLRVRRRRRTVERARSMPPARLDVPLAELVAAWEQLGEARAHAGDLSGAADAFDAHAGSSSVTSSARQGCVQRQAHVHERVGRTVAAVRSARAGPAHARGRRGAGRGRVRAQLITTLGAVRQRQGRHREAARLCRRRLRRPRRPGTSCARACVLPARLGARRPRAPRRGGALRSGAGDLRARRRSGPAGRGPQQPRHVRLLGRRLGRGDRALRAGAEASMRAGDIANAAFGDCNVAEVLADQGRSAEAEARLRRARRVWRGTEDAHGVAFARRCSGG